ncbi:MAG: hypothetical protein HYV15_06440, partial [Elusimicrobia bacterium]|nr:hypothetical protein [Elusimicrobiota bacterium]
MTARPDSSRERSRMWVRIFSMRRMFFCCRSSIRSKSASMGPIEPSRMLKFAALMTVSGLRISCEMALISSSLSLSIRRPSLTWACSSATRRRSVMSRTTTSEAGASSQTM